MSFYTSGQLLLLAGSGAIILAPPEPPRLRGNANPVRVTLRWDSGTGAEEFRLRRRILPSGSFSEVPESPLPGDAFWYRDENVVNGETYEYELVGVNSEGETDPEVVEVTIPEPSTGTSRRRFGAIFPILRR